ncbi:anion permease [Bradyrhizobium sp. CCBAU 051011]|uniref:anion permease n=1 Tax=Bradyrhizobium sp. CCBAU 051011 TaxID=858422 RepID=UPI00210FE225|nr:anion permease [Bradyrhizobium sp. CCBAU 051011]
MTATGLDKRIALTILSRVGGKVHHVVLGAILVGFVMAFLVPSTTARVACLVPIMLGIIAAFGVNRKGAFAGMLMIATAPASGTSGSRPPPRRTWSRSASSRRLYTTPSPGWSGLSPRRHLEF